MHGAERNLLGVLLAHTEWVDRARHDGILPEWFERPEYREIFAQLLAGATLPDALSDAAQPVWQELKGRQFGAAENAGDLYEGAREALEAAPQLREYDALQRRIGIAAVEERDALVRRSNELRAALMQRFPRAWDARAKKKVR